MAEVTITAGTKHYSVNGDVRTTYAQVTGANGDTLTTGLYRVRQVVYDPGTITSYTVTALTSGGQLIGNTIALVTGGGAFTNANISVIGN